MMKHRARYLVLGFFLNGCDANRNEFAVEMIPLSGGNWEAIKYNTATGLAWSAQQGVWVEIFDRESPPRSHYAIKLAVADDSGWGAIRLDTISGRAWSASGGSWIEIQH